MADTGLYDYCRLFCCCRYIWKTQPVTVGGLRFTYEPESLEDTEFAFYYANYHSSLPFIDYELDENAAASAAAEVAAGLTWW